MLVTTLCRVPRPLALAAVAVTAMLGLSACAAESNSAGDGTLSIVASTNVYGSIATAIAGDHAKVTSIIDSTAQDPHSFEGSARTQLALSKADIVIENGGGYDPFMDLLLKGANNPDAVVLNAVTIAGPTADGNEHVWYSPDFMMAFATQLGASLATLDSDNAVVYQANVTTFNAQVLSVRDRLAAIAGEHAGEGVAITEPVPGYFLEAAGLKNLTPSQFSAAIEAGSGVSPELLATTLRLFTSHSVTVLVYNTQTEGPESEQLRAAAKANGIPVLGFTETLPAGLDYPEWMADNATALAGALAGAGQ